MPRIATKLFDTLELAKADKPSLTGKDGKVIEFKLYKVCVPAIGENPAKECFVWDRSPMSAYGRVLGTLNCGFACTLAEEPIRAKASPIERATHAVDKLSAEEKAALIAKLMGSTAPVVNAAPVVAETKPAGDKPSLPRRKVTA
jgi:hypothetical protein